MTRLEDEDDECEDQDEEKDLVPVLKQGSLAPSSSRRYATTDSGTGSSSRKRLSNITSNTNPGGGEQPELIELDEAEDLANIHQTLRDPNINKLNILDSLYEGTFRGRNTFKG